MHTIAVLLSLVWGGMWWRFRGGAFTALTHIDPGTGGMRAIAAVAMSIPVILNYPHLVSVLSIPGLWVAWSLAGWGAFQGMGHEVSVEQKNPVAHILSRRIRSLLALDVLGMAIEGIHVMTILTIFLAPALYMRGGTTWLIEAGVLLLLSGTTFSPIYDLMQHIKRLPNLGRFARAGSEWAEVTVGVWVMWVLLTVI